MKQVILFDVDGVLIHGYHARHELRQCWDEYLERDFGIARDIFAKEFIFGLFREVVIGKRDLHDALAEWLPTQGYNGDAQGFIDYWLKNDAKINQDLIDKIARIQSSHQVSLFIATNQEHNRARYLMNELKFSDYFEDIFHSAKVGATKPNPAYYQWVEDHLKLGEGQKPIFFDDTPAVVAGAREFGWEAHEFISAEDLNRSPFVKKLLSRSR